MSPRIFHDLKDILTLETISPSQAGIVCGCTQWGIKDWIAAGHLRAYKTPGGHIRIRKEWLSNMLTERNMPNPYTNEGM